MDSPASIDGLDYYYHHNSNNETKGSATPHAMITDDRPSRHTIEMEERPPEYSLGRVEDELMAILPITPAPAPAPEERPSSVRSYEFVEPARKPRPRHFVFLENKKFRLRTLVAAVVLLLALAGTLVFLLVPRQPHFSMGTPVIRHFIPSVRHLRGAHKSARAIAFPIEAQFNITSDSFYRVDLAELRIRAWMPDQEIATDVPLAEGMLRDISLRPRATTTIDMPLEIPIALGSTTQIATVMKRCLKNKKIRVVLVANTRTRAAAVLGGASRASFRQYYLDLPCPLSEVFFSRKSKKPASSNEDPLIDR